MRCIRCGSYAINHGSHGRDGSDPELCDVCYWRKRAEESAKNTTISPIKFAQCADCANNALNHKPGQRASIAMLG